MLTKFLLDGDNVRIKGQPEIYVILKPSSVYPDHYEGLVAYKAGDIVPLGTIKDTSRFIDVAFEDLEFYGGNNMYMGHGRYPVFNNE